LNEYYIDIPFIFISGTIGEEVAVQTMKNGANDYILKSNLSRLLPAVEREIRVSEERAKKILLEQKEKQIEESLHESKNLIQNIIDNSPSLIYILDLDGKFNLANKRLSEVLNTSAEKIIGNSRQLFMTKKFADQHRNNDLQIISTKQAAVYEEEIMESDGQHTYLTQKFPLFDSEDKLYAIGGISTDITESKQVEEELQHERKLLRLLIDNIPDLIYIKDTACRKTIANIADVRHTGVKSESKVLGKDDFAFHPEEIAEKFYADDLSVLQTGKPLLNKEEFTINEDDQKKWLLTSKFPLRDEKSKIIGLVGITRDITERKLAEEAIYKSKEQYRLLVETAPDIIFTIASDGTFTSLSPAFETLLFWLPEEWIGKPFVGLIHPDDLPLLLNIFEQAMQGVLPSVFEARVLTKKDNYLFFEYVIKLIMENGEIKSLMGIARHITERKKAEEKINMLAQAIENSADSIAITNNDYIIIFVNDSFCKVYGFEKEEVIGKPISVLTSKNNLPEVSHSLYSTLDRKEAWTGEVLNKRKDGNDFPVQLSLAPVIDDKGELIAIVGVLRDITEQRRSEAEIKLKNEQLQKLNAEKDKFFSIIAHDMKNSFNSIVGFSDLLLTHIKEKNFDDVEKYSEIIWRSSIRTMNLLMNLMEWSQSQTGRMVFKPEYFELSDLIIEIELLFADIAEQKSINITKELFHNTPVFADRAMIGTVLRNLISNAIKFTKPKGNIIISTVEKNNELEISVNDNGVGVPKSAINKLFRIDEDYTTVGTQNEKGTGLGLVLCKDFVEKHSGKIWVESEQEKGTTIYFTIP
jgi:PAS domain S-box-containing protein